MASQINKDGFFESQKKHKGLAQNKIVLDFRDIYARPVLKTYAETCEDEELAVDIITGLYNTRTMFKVPD